MTYVKTYLLPLKTSNMMASASRVTSSSLRVAVNVELRSLLSVLRLQGL